MDGGSCSSWRPCTLPLPAVVFGGSARALGAAAIAEGLSLHMKDSVQFKCTQDFHLYL